MDGKFPYEGRGGFMSMPDFHLRAIHLDAGFPHQRDSPRCCISVPGGFTRLPVKAKLREKRSGC